MKNLKIGYKLLLGFCTVLFVFVMSVFFMWQYISAVEKNNVHLAAKMVPALELTAALNSQAYELFLTALALQYKEDQESVDAYRAQLDDCLKVENEVRKLNEENPDLKGPEYIVKVTSVVAKQYIDITEQIVPLIAKKRDLLESIRVTGQSSTDAIAKLLAEFVKMSKNNSKAEYDSNTKVGTIMSGIKSTTVNNTLDAIEICAKLAEDFMAKRRDIWRAVATNDIDSLHDIRNGMSSLQKSAENLTPFLTTQEEKTALELLITAFSVYNVKLNDFISTYLEVDKLNKECAPLMESLNNECTAAASLSFNRLKEASNESVNFLEKAILVMLIATVVAVILGLGVSFVISRGISNPLKTIVKIAKRAGEGDLTARREDFNYESKDEMGALVVALSAMIDTQEKTIHKIVDVAENLVDGAGNLSAISEETNAAMEEVKASIDQVSALSENNGAALEKCNYGVDEMSVGANTVAQSATESANYIAQTTDASNKAIRTVNDVIAGMHNVDKNSKESEVKTQQLVASVKNVSSFVSVITSIADQTNLLALNAAIEAARAGEVGRGFAVVAEEVRKLAEESARAAESVNKIIFELQNGAQDSIKATMEASRMLGETLIQAEQAQKELDEALKEMNHTNDSIQNIAAVAEEQAASSKEVASAIDIATKSTIETINTISNIRRAADETALAAQNVASQSETMSGQAHALTEALSLFKLRASAEPAHKLVKA